MKHFLCVAASILDNPFEPGSHGQGKISGK